MPTSPFATSEVYQLWSQVQQIMDDADQRNDLLEQGYTESMHKALTDLAWDDQSASQEPRQVQSILAPIKRFYEHKIAVEMANSSSAQNRHDNMTRKVIQLTPQRNEQLDNILQRHTQAAFQHEHEAHKLRGSLNLVDFILADPRLKQFDPGFDARGMNM